MPKECRVCGRELNNGYSLTRVCSQKCYDRYKHEKQERREQFKNEAKQLVDNRKKNETRDVTEIVKRRVYERDGGRCIICHRVTCDEFHHVFYGAEAEHCYERNHANKLVLLCHECHHQLHFTGATAELREYCKHYLYETYKNKLYQH